MKKNIIKGLLVTEKVPVKHILLIMRTSFILLFITAFSSMASSGYTQNARSKYQQEECSHQGGVE